MTLKEIMAAGAVIPVVVIDDVADALPLADALSAGGISVIEITLRSPAALDAIAAIARHRGHKRGGHSRGGHMIVGAGTVLNPRQITEVKEAGADFIVSPGAYPGLIAAADAADMPLLPGAATASEVMTLLAVGFTEMKFFPAMAAGGVGYLKALAAPLAAVRFCPTGGITLEAAKDWLALPNVACVGGSWVASRELLARGDFAAIAANAKACTALGGAPPPE